MIEIPVAVDRRPHEYRIIVDGFLPERWADEIERRVPASSYFLAIDANVAEHHPLEQAVASRPNWRSVRLNAGEEHKNVADYTALFERMLDAGLDRKAVAVALGGGVVGDMVGFAAATFMRGIRFVQVPTTLLAQVDSSVGGKTGINMAGGKNLLGAFHQPDLVLIDPAFLATLPQREYLAGLAEVLKYGVISDRRFFQDLIGHAPKLAERDPAVLAQVVAHCCQMKADIVAADETEKGRRGLLNLGHTFGHALESLAGYDGSVVHGEAVSVGMAMAARFACEQGLMPAPEEEILLAGMRSLSLPVSLNELGKGRDDASYWAKTLRREALEAILLKDKKSSSGTLTLILPHAVGDTRMAHGVEAAAAADLMVRLAAL